MIQILAALAVSTLAAADAPSEVAVRIEEGRALIENPFLSIEVGTVGKKIHTRSITNRITGQATSFEGEDFFLVMASGHKYQAKDFSIDRAAEEVVEPGPDGAAGGKRLAFDLSREDLRLILRIEARPTEPWATRWIDISGGQGRLEEVSLSEWQCQGAWGHPMPRKTTPGFGLPEGCGQTVYVNDLFFGIEHPGAENFVQGKQIACRIPAYDDLGPGKTVRTRRFVVGAGEEGGALRAFLRFLDTRRANPARMTISVDAHWSKGEMVAAMKDLGNVKARGLPIDSFYFPANWSRNGELLSLLTRGRESDRLFSAARALGMGIVLRIDAVIENLRRTVGVGQRGGP